ncbi:preprotein translocase subunit SecG [Sphingomonas sabuli]|uniref:Protein-export membrane protein SecG n=1 Tax=Sphingomonas sabuli TaxID=2764186 RepID=A0A7G9L2W9_9SPHN|nr:preprotein translocase subunit SecG [Sphingomonas sabuli]QNM82968.1 preprotein translocase subunit SecG [Sphingomonas sabuli]
MFTFLLIVQTLVAAALVAVILMQRSEGGGLGVGGSSSGFMTARGAADFLTRSTAVLAAIFIALAILLAAIAGVSRDQPTIDTSLARPSAPATSPTGTPLPGQQPTQQQPAEQTPAPAGEQPAVPVQ